MKNLSGIIALLFAFLLLIACNKDEEVSPPVVAPGKTGLLIINHSNINLAQIPSNWIDSAKAKLHIAYAHTSHGSQLITGMSGLEAWKGAPYLWNDGPSESQLDVDDNFVSGDLGNPDRTTWASRTRTYLIEQNDVNVVMWSWCGQVSSSTEEDINTYLSLMQGLENDFPTICFVYMTGHLDGSGEEGNLHLRNEQIRKFCTDNKKVLFDFADIESYDPDGNYYLDKDVDDECYYDSDNNGSLDANWGQEWQNSHTVDVDWFDCSPAHTEAINGNMKAYAAWWLWARLGGWDGQ